MSPAAVLPSGLIEKHLKALPAKSPGWTLRSYLSLPCDRTNPLLLSDSAVEILPSKAIHTVRIGPS